MTRQKTTDSDKTVTANNHVQTYNRRNGHFPSQPKLAGDHAKVISLCRLLKWHFYTFFVTSKQHRSKQTIT